MKYFNFKTSSDAKKSLRGILKSNLRNVLREKYCKLLMYIWKVYLHIKIVQNDDMIYDFTIILCLAIGLFHIKIKLKENHFSSLKHIYITEYHIQAV